MDIKIENNDNIKLSENQQIHEEDSSLSDSKSTTTETEENICCICYEKLEIKPSKTLQCEHKFHTDCIDHWIILRTIQIRDPNCPLCKAEIDVTELDLYQVAIDLQLDNQLISTQNLQNSIFIKWLGYPSLHGYKYLWLMMYFIALMSIDLRQRLVLSLLLFCTLTMHIWQSTLFIRYYTALTTMANPDNAFRDMLRATTIVVTLGLSYSMIMLIITQFIVIIVSIPNKKWNAGLVICLVCDTVAVIFSLIYIVDVHLRSCCNNARNVN